VRLIDTSVAVDHLRGHPAATDLLVRSAANGDDLVASQIVRFELLAGVRQREMPALELFFQAVAWVPVEAEIARVAGRMARKFRRSHSGIDDADYLIAGTALVLDAELLTMNVRHFPMFAGLTAPY
jgi:predicted nucleic acid-binding protein